MRLPAVAGEFYEGSRERLLRQIEWCYTHRLGPGKIPSLQKGERKMVGLVSPHAGYMYSDPWRPTGSPPWLRMENQRGW